MNDLNKIFPTEIERVRKVVKQYYFDGFPVISLDYVISRLKHYQRDGSTVYRGYLEVTYLSVERELYKLRY